MPAADGKTWCFATFALDLRRGCLRQDGREIRLRPKSFAVLRYLIENAGRLVSKDELIQAIWPDVVVTDESVSRCISDVRQALGDGARRIITTAARRGYVFTAPVSDGTGPSAVAMAELTRPPQRPSIAVLPFASVGHDPDLVQFTDGIVEEITTELCKRRWLFVPARNSCATYRGRAVDVRQVGQELGVRYVLDGSVRGASGRLRTSAQLIDAADGGHIWANTFDGEIEEAFELQDRIAARIVAEIETRLRTTARTTASSTPAADLDPRELYLRALEQGKQGNVMGLSTAISLLKQALALNPSYHPAAALLRECRAGLRLRTPSSVACRSLLLRQGIPAD